MISEWKMFSCAAFLIENFVKFKSAIKLTIGNKVNNTVISIYGAGRDLNYQREHVISYMNVCTPETNTK